MTCPCEPLSGPCRPHGGLSPLPGSWFGLSSAPLRPHVPPLLEPSCLLKQSDSPRSCSPGFSRAAAGAIPSICRSPQPPAPWLHSFPSSLSWWPRPGPRDGLSLIIQEISARAAAVSLAPALLRLRGSELLLGAGSTKNTSCLSPK